MFVKYSIRGVALLSAVLFFSFPAISDSAWYWQHPYPTGSLVNGIQYTDNNNGWLVTHLGEVFRTNDGGTNWDEVYRGEEALESVCFINNSEGWVCGEEGIVLHTTDSGQNWSSSYPTSVYLFSIEFIDENYGTITGTGGLIMRSMNGGDSWQLQGSGISSQIYDVSFVNMNTGWTTGSTGNALNTVTAGAFWEVQNTGIPSVDYRGVHFVDENYGFVVGEDYIAFTDDGGDSWSAAFQLGGADFSDVDFAGNLGAASGNTGVAVTEDQGVNWSIEYMPIQPILPYVPYPQSVAVTSESRVITGCSHGVLYSRDAAGDWTQLSSHETLQDLSNITHFDEYHIWACGENGIIMRSTDGGVNWTSLVTDNEYSLRDVCFPSVLTGYCAGTVTGGTGVILKTVDGGSNWTDITPISITLDGLQSIDFMDEDRGVSVGVYGEIVFTTDGGASWTEKTGFGSSHLSSVRFGDTDRGWVVGGSGKILCFDFTSDSWSEQMSPMTNTFYGLFALNADTVWAVGWNGTIVRTQNAGDVWDTIAITGNDYSDVWFAENGLDGYLSGLPGKKFGTTANGGFTVTHSAYGSENQLSNISFLDAENGWGCGYNGMILRFGEDPTGIEDFNQPASLTPITGIMSSPNPFTSLSTVSFTLPEECFVRLDLYDLAGRRIQTIQSGILSSGEHNLIVNGADLTPGMYFLKLTTGGDSETRAIVRIP